MKIETKEELIMLDGVFARGTTPTHIFPLIGDFKQSDFIDFTVIYRQKGKIVLKKRKEDVKPIYGLDGERNIILVLSQAETLMFNPKIKIVEVQIKGATYGQDVIPLGEYRLRLEDTFDEEEFNFEENKR
jgi:hypothetical protein